MKRALAMCLVAVFLASLVSAQEAPAAGADGPSPSGYDCKTMIPELIEISKQNQGGLFPAHLLDIVEIRQASSKPDRLECRGTGLWSDTSRGPLRYFAHLEFGTWWLQYESAD